MTPKLGLLMLLSLVALVPLLVGLLRFHRRVRPVSAAEVVLVVSCSWAIPVLCSLSVVYLAGDRPFP